MVILVRVEIVAVCAVSSRGLDVDALDGAAKGDGETDDDADATWAWGRGAGIVVVFEEKRYQRRIAGLGKKAKKTVPSSSRLSTRPRRQTTTSTRRGRRGRQDRG